MFRNLRITLFLFYVITFNLFFVLAYMALFVLNINLYVVGVIFFSLTLLSAVFISKLAVDPLSLYVKNLQSLSKETLHELNLPISTIKTNLQMLQKKSDDEKMLKRLSRIAAACDMLQERYNELDYMIKMQTKSAAKEEFFLDELLFQRVEFIKRLYPQFTFELKSKHTLVKMDKRGLCKVVDNLIDNGVKYSGSSRKIVIENGSDYLSIEDFGIGMSEMELLKIFDAYYQINEEMQGFGIGLNMVKRFCDENGIELVFDSQKGRGTKVILYLKNEGKK